MASGNQISLVNAISAFFSDVNARVGGVLARPGSMAKAVAHQVIVFVALLLIVIQLIIFVAIDNAVSVNAQQKTREELQVGERIFLRLLGG